MLIWILSNLTCFRYDIDIYLSLIFRMLGSLLTSFFVSLWIYPILISWFKRLNITQIIRNNGPISHFMKCNTPTMGGVGILFIIFFSVLIWCNLKICYTWYVLFILLSYGCIGYLDDYYKIIRKNSVGIPAIWKYFWQSIIFLLIMAIMLILEKGFFFNRAFVVSCQDILYCLKIDSILISYFTVVGASNSVNLSDGLDGLAIIPVILVAIGLAIVSWIVSSVDLAYYFGVVYLESISEILIICGAIIGSGLGFLWFNIFPAKIFMGDVGSLSLGGTLGIIAVILNKEFFLFIIGGIFVIEALSVIFQVIIFKLFRRRIFLMAPMHHHLELNGLSEIYITIRCWIISLLFLFLGLLIL